MADEKKFTGVISGNVAFGNREDGFRIDGPIREGVDFSNNVSMKNGGHGFNFRTRADAALDEFGIPATVDRRALADVLRELSRVPEKERPGVFGRLLDTWGPRVKTLSEIGDKVLAMAADPRVQHFVQWLTSVSGNG